MSARVVLLGRVSRGERTQDPEGQLGPLRAAAERHGWRVVEEISLKMSAWDEKAAAEVRRRALALIEAGRADTLMVWSLDRLVRGGAVQALQFIERLEKHYGAAFYSLQEPNLSTASDPQTRELMVGVLAWVAKWESQRKSERLKAKAAAKRARAGALGERATWGRGKLASEEDMRRARLLRAQGGTVRAIAAELGVSKSQVARILAVPPQAAGQDEAPPVKPPPSTGGGLGQRTSRVQGGA